jgi:hypothetical protein
MSGGRMIKNRRGGRILRNIAEAATPSVTENVTNGAVDVTNGAVVVTNTA